MQLTFGPINLEQQEAYRKRLSQCASIASDYSFANLFGWGPEYDLQWAWHNDLVWIRQSLPFPALWAPVGDWNAVAWPSMLEMVAAMTDRIIRVPEALYRMWGHALPTGSTFAETRGQWDYLYTIEDLVQLKGNRFHKKKNLVHQFKKNYVYDYVPFGRKMIDQALGMQEDWCTWRDCESDETLASENKAIEKILSNWHRLQGLTGGALRVENTLVAYTIAEQMPDRTIVIHFEKGNSEYKGSYQAINQMFLENLSVDADTVNREQDLDNEGLRKAKLSYHPVGFIKKHEVILES
jgi:hypothetical protein